MQIKTEIFIAALISIITFGVYYYLFGCADRKIVFLYGHLGLTPFDSMTTGRYWMAGFVLSGFIAILYLFFRLLLRFVLRPLKISRKVVVRYSVLPVVLGVVFIMMNTGEPQMSFLISISSALALITGIALGLSIADDLTESFRSTVIYLITGFGAVPFLVLFRVVELPGEGIVSVSTAILVLLILIAGGFTWLFLFYRIFKQNRPDRINVIKGILATGYVGLPLIHYLVATPPGIPYITSSDNFFAGNLLIRIVNWFLLILLVFIAERLSKRSNPLDAG